MARFADLRPHELYGILKLRSDVFIVEQDCAYDDIDGRDAEPTTRHPWGENDAGLIAALRPLRNRDGAYHIGRVTTHSAHRRRGIAAALMRHAMSLAQP